MEINIFALEGVFKKMKRRPHNSISL